MPSRPILRGAFASVLTAAALLGGASPALAGHLQGGSITASVTDTGQLQGALTYAEATACVVGAQKSMNVTVTAPTAQTAAKPVSMTATRCIPGASTYAGTFDIPLDTSTFSGGAPDGEYSVYATSSARVSGIQNLTGMGTVKYTAKVRKVAMQATSSPKYGSNVANGIAIGKEYKQNLNAVDPDGGAVTYATLLAPDDPDAPDTDIITLDGATGRIAIPAAVTAGFTGGWYYVYKVRATDAQGDYAERDVLLKVASTNHQPTFTGLSAQYTVAPGGSLSIPVTATDADGADTVTISAGSLPSWATLNATPGNPGTATLVVNPPAGTTGTFGINLDAVDDSSDVALTDAAYTEIVVADDAALAAPAITSAPPAKQVSTTAKFAFTGVAGATFECRLDGGAWATCASPHAVPAVALGKHTFEVRQSVKAKVSPAASAAFEVVGLSLTTDKGFVDYTNATPVLPDTVNPKTGKTKVACNLTGVTACTVKVYVTVGGKKVLVGTGKATASGKTEGIAVPVTLNARGRKLVNRSGGIKATFELAATAEGTTVNATKSARMLPAATTAVVRSGLDGKRLNTYLRSLKRELSDAKSVTCVARDVAAAKATCKRLATFGVKAKLKASRSAAKGDRVKLKIAY